MNYSRFQPPVSIPSLRPAIFLDRDGTLMEEVDHCHEPEKVRAILGAAEALAKAKQEGWLTIIITNQSGIGRGYFTKRDFDAVQTELLSQLGGSIDGVYMAPDNPENLSSQSTAAAKSCVAPVLPPSSTLSTLSCSAPAASCSSSAAATLKTDSVFFPRRKPAPGMLLEAAADFAIDLSASFMIGDRASDIEAGRAAGCRSILVLTSYGKEHLNCGADFIVKDVVAGINLALELTKKKED